MQRIDRGVWGRSSEARGKIVEAFIAKFGASRRVFAECVWRRRRRSLFESELLPKMPPAGADLGALVPLRPRRIDATTSRRSSRRTSSSQRP